MGARGSVGRQAKEGRKALPMMGRKLVRRARARLMRAAKDVERERIERMAKDR